MKTYKINHKLFAILTIAGLVSSIASVMVLEICKAITRETDAE